MTKQGVKVKVGKKEKGQGKRGKGERNPRPLPVIPSPSSLLAWYDRHQRILPWRARSGAVADPYHVWLSEIMLQQTTVGAVGPYFRKFLNRWPTIRHLARASRDNILRMWAGLGYYRRAHLLHECAKTIVRDHDGEFPQTEAELKALPGFGPYTAAAVASIAFGGRANVVDGNVERVIARIHAVRTPLPQAKTELRALAETLLPDDRFGDYAQALMDLGATICTPRKPKCGLCPWNKSCRAHDLGIEESLPRRTKAKAKPVRRAIAFFAVNGKGEVLLRRRPKEGLLGGMMEIPSSQWREGAMPDLAEVAKQSPVRARWQLLPGFVSHTFTHFEFEIAVAVGHVARPVGGYWVALERLNDEALPSVMRKIVRRGAEAAIIRASS